MKNRIIQTERRIGQVRSALASWGVDGILVTSPANRRWLSGFSGSACQLLITQQTSILATDFRYWERAPQEAPAFALYKHRRRPEDAEAFLKAGAASKIAVEAKYMTLAEMEALRAVSGIEWVPLPATLEIFRARKDPAELDLIRRAAAITDRAMSLVNQLARPGMKERELAWDLERLMRQDGADAMAFTPIVASGPNSALPHYHPGDRPLREGDVIVIDMGAEVGGYKSDLTRTFFMGDEPSAEFWRVFQLVSDANEAAVEGARAGMNGKQLDSLARDLIVAAGYGDQFGHGLGHGVGLEVHEEPSLSQRSEAEQSLLRDGMIVTIEPGIYLPGWGGVRVEDLVLFTENGVESLSQCPKEPLIPTK